MDQRALARPAHPGDAGQCGQGDSGFNVFEVVHGGVADPDPSRTSRQPTATVRVLDEPGAAAEVLARDRALRREQLRGRPRRDDQAPIRAGPGPEVHDPIRRLDHRFVVLDDQDAVAQLLKPSEAVDQPRGVARMEPGRRLVQDIADPDQPRAELRRQPGPLELAAGERVRAAAQRQVIQADVEQVPEPADDLDRQRSGDRLPSRIESERSEELEEVGDGHRDELLDRPPFDADRACLGPEPTAAAGRADDLLAVSLERLAEALVLGLLVGPIEQDGEPRERSSRLAVPERPRRLRRPRFDRLAAVQLVSGQEIADRRLVGRVVFHAFGQQEPGHDGPFVPRPRSVGHGQIGPERLV